MSKQVLTVMFVQNMLHGDYLVLSSSLCPNDAGFRLCEMLKVNYNYSQGRSFSQEKKKTPHWYFKRTQQNLSPRWSHIRLYRPLHVYLSGQAHHSLKKYKLTVEKRQLQKLRLMERGHQEAPDQKNKQNPNS